MKAKRQLTSLYITAHIDESIACVVSPSYSQHSCARSTMYYMHWISLLQPVSTAYTATITNEYMSAHIFIVYFYIYYITLWAYINENLVIWNEWCVAHRPCLINNLNKLCIYFGWMSHNKHTHNTNFAFRYASAATTTTPRANAVRATEMILFYTSHSWSSFKLIV